MISDPSQNGGADDRRAFLSALIYQDWQQPGGVIEFSEDLTLGDVADATHFQNVRTILRALVEDDGTPATATGCFNRAFSARMFEELCIPNLDRESMRRMCKVINEADVPDLNLLRAVCEFGGLISRRKKRLRATRRGRQHLADDHAGRLFRDLFMMVFRKLDLRDLFPLRAVPGIQQTLAVILWRLDSVARDWVPFRGLAEQVLLPRVLDELRATKYPHDTDEWIFGGYVIEPLADFGLIEVRERATQWPGIMEKDSIQLTALWRRFVRFSPTGK
ncbi:MAG: hypothetical protein ABI680_09425 [Chthoniobacteraceae bacterium]